MYIETSFPRKQGDKAQFLSPKYPATQTKPKCFNFFYHMYGDHIGSMNIYVKTGLGIGKLVWNMTGNQGNTWQHGRATVDSGSSPFNVSICLIKGLLSILTASLLLMLFY